MLNYIELYQNNIYLISFINSQFQPHKNDINNEKHN